MPPIQHHPLRHCSPPLHHAFSCWDAEGALRAHQSHTPVWSDSNRRHRPRTDRWRRVGSHAGRQTAPLPGEAQGKACIPPAHNKLSENKLFLLFGWVVLSSFPLSDAQASTRWNGVNWNKPKPSSTSNPWVYSNRLFLLHWQTWNSKC